MRIYYVSKSEKRRLQFFSQIRERERERERERIKLTKMLYLGKKVVTNRLVLGKRKIKGKEAIGDCQINHKIRQLGYVLMQTCSII